MITRITIKSEPVIASLKKNGKDRLTITRNSVRYEYEPLMPSEKNPADRWTGTCNDEKFESMFHNLCAEVGEIMSRAEDFSGAEHDLTTFTVMHDDGKREERTFQVPDEAFAVCFTIVDQIVKRARG